MTSENEKKNIEFRYFQTSQHAIFNNGYHIVFATKYRKRIIGPILTKELNEIYLKMALEKPDGLEIIGIGIETDHVHLLLKVPPSLQISRAVQRIKGVASRILFQKYPELEEKIGKRALWQTGYFCRALGNVNIPQIKAYLGKQKKELYFG